MPTATGRRVSSTGSCNESVGQKIDTAIRLHPETLQGNPFTGGKYPAFINEIRGYKQGFFLLADHSEATLYLQVKLTWK